MAVVYIRCPLCAQRVPLVEMPSIDTHGQTPPLTYAQLAEHGEVVHDEVGRAWDVLCPQAASASSKPLLSRPR